MEGIGFFQTLLYKGENVSEVSGRFEFSTVERVRLFDAEGEMCVNASAFDLIMSEVDMSPTLTIRSVDVPLVKRALDDIAAWDEDDWRVNMRDFPDPEAPALGERVEGGSDGDEFTVAFVGEGYRVEWTCSPRLDWEMLERDVELSLADVLRATKHESLTGPHYAKQQRASVVAPHIYEGLRRYLPQLGDELRTPNDFDNAVSTFLYGLSYELRDAEEARMKARRASWAPNLRALMRQARASARTMPTGLDELDRIEHGGWRAGLYPVLGDPGTGKTALAVLLALFAAHGCESGERAVYAMADMGGESEIAKRLLSVSWAIRRAMEGEPANGCELSRADCWTDDEVDGAMSSYRELSHDRLVLLGLTRGDYDALMRALRAMEKEGNVRPRLLVLDYVQLLHGQFDGADLSVESNAEYAAFVMADLRRWAMAHGCAVLLISEFTKEAIARHRKGGEPTLTDALGSVSIGYAANDALALSNSQDGTGRVEVRALKARFAGNMAQGGRHFTLTLDGEHGCFTE